MDRISTENMNAVLARLERVQLVPPADLTGTALEMFKAIAEGNRSRPWSAAHGYALADYCRVAAAYQQETALIETEGRMVAGKVNARFKVLALLSTERLRMAKLLGLHCGPRDIFLGGSGKVEKKHREAGALLAEGDADPDGDLLN